MTMSDVDRANSVGRKLFIEHIEAMYKSHAKEKDWTVDKLNQWSPLIHRAMSDLVKVFPWDIDPEDIPVEVPAMVNESQEPIRKLKDLAGKVRLNIG